MSTAVGGVVTVGAGGTGGGSAEGCDEAAGKRKGEAAGVVGMTGMRC